MKRPSLKSISRRDLLMSSVRARSPARLVSWRQSAAVNHFRRHGGCGRAEGHEAEGELLRRSYENSRCHHDLRAGSCTGAGLVGAGTDAAVKRAAGVLMSLARKPGSD